MDTEDPTYAYLIILPSPILGNSIKATGGVEYADPENLSQDEPSKTEKNKLVHYIKLGLQKEPGERVKSYNTDTPSSKLRLLSAQGMC